VDGEGSAASLARDNMRHIGTLMSVIAMLSARGRM
jgi:hypothetical protein